MNRLHLTPYISIVIASAVLLSSLHVSQVLGTAALAHDQDKKVSTHDDTSVGKIASELHHHSDKSGSQLIKDAGDHQLYADSRSLRLRAHKKEHLRDRLAARWARAWHEMALIHVF